jgi:hypothetical protein
MRAKGHLHKLDCVFVIDATGSMESAIDAIRDRITTIATKIQGFQKGHKVHPRFAAVCYRDPVDDPNAESEHEVFDFIEDPAELDRKLQSVSATGGGDTPEDWAGAMQLLLKLSWRSDAIRWVCWIADAPAHGLDFGGTVEHNDQIEPLCQAIATFAKTSSFFVGLCLNDNALPTFEKMKKLWSGASEKVFSISSFSEDSQDGTQPLAEHLTSLAVNSICETLLQENSIPGVSRSILPKCIGMHLFSISFTVSILFIICILFIVTRSCRLFRE